jgi:HlyD family secretion protein
MLEKLKSALINRSKGVAKVLNTPTKQIIAAVFAFVIVGALIGIASFGAGTSATVASGDLQIQPVEVGQLTSSIGATGQVRAGQSATLNWQTTGIVEEVYVTEGQQVVDGEVLAYLEPSSLPQSVINAQSELLDAQDELDAFYDSFTGVSLASAQETLADAQDALDSTGYTFTSLQSPANATDIDQAYADVLLAQQNLDKAQDRYDPYSGKSEDNLTRASLLAALGDAQEAFDSAARTYNGLLNGANSTDLGVAEADYAVALANFTAAQEDYDRLLAGPTSEEIAAAEGLVTAAEANLNQAKIQSPFDGTITSAFSQSGDVVSGQTQAFRVDNLTQLFIDVEVNELDVNKVTVGQDVIISLDAIRNEEFQGEVVSVSLAGDNSSGVVNFEVTIEIFDTDERIKPGMTAAVEILISDETAVLLVPNQAIRLENGVQVVFVIDAQGALQPVTITLGQSSDTYSQVISGNLQQGDMIVLNPIDDNLATEGGAGFGAIRAIGGGGGQGGGGGNFGGDAGPGGGGRQ